MGKVLMWTGGLWALLGLADIIEMFAQGVSAGWAAGGLIFNFVLFILPGLAVYGIGSRMSVHGARVACRFCDEKISARASICPHCRRELAEIPAPAR